MNRLVVGTAALLLFLVAAGAGVQANLTRSSLREAERSGDFSFERMLKDDPVRMLGGTRAVYLDGYGVVLSAELDIAPALTPNPFRPAFSKEEVERNREKKKARVATLRDHMRNMLIFYSKSIEIPLEQNVALAVTIPYSRTENAEGLPRQIVMSAPRGALRSGNGPAISANLKLQEFF